LMCIKYFRVIKEYRVQRWVSIDAKDQFNHNLMIVKATVTSSPLKAGRQERNDFVHYSA